MHEKNYQKWHTQKAAINSEKDRPHFHEREIWFCSLGANIGFEQDGRGDDYLRPVIILRKFNQQVCLAVPLTKNYKKGIHYFNFSYQNSFISTAILSQIRLIDAKRLEYKSGNITEIDFNQLKQKLKQLLA